MIAALEGVDTLNLPVIALGEYRYGISQSRYKARYEEWLNQFVADCSVFDVIKETTHHYAAINIELWQAGNPIPINDLWIAALCRQYDLALASRDHHLILLKEFRESVGRAHLQGV